MPLISSDELAARLTIDRATGSVSAGRADGPERPVIVCDVRFSLADHGQGWRHYQQAHLPEARFVDLHHELADVDRRGAGRHPLPSVESFAALLGQLGVTPEHTVVSYDDAGGAIASRLWWMLRSIGHADAAVLDGGIQAWNAAGHPLTAEVPAPVSDVTPYPLEVDDWTGIVDIGTVDDLDTDTVALIDARAAERYTGEVEPVDRRAGHIPGAINIFHGDTIGDDGRHRSADELAELFADVTEIDNTGGSEPPVVYCGSGVTACHLLLAMHVAGVTDPRLYPGSWSQWSTRSDR